MVREIPWSQYKKLKFLDLPIKGIFYDMIESGVKLEEYRSIKKHWIDRLFENPDMFNSLSNSCIECRHQDYGNHDDIICGLQSISVTNLLCDINKFDFKNGYYKHYDAIRFRNGYRSDSRSMTFMFNGVEIGNTKPEWADGWDERVFIIHIGDRFYAQW
jgi:hypothetical protein